MVLLWVVNNTIIITLPMVFFIIFTKYFKDIFFISHFSISVLPSNIFSLLKYISFVIITLFYGGI